MADRIITQLIVEGASKYVQDFASAEAANNRLTAIVESAGVRQRVAYDQVTAAQQRAAIAAEDSAKRQADAAQRAAEASTRASVQIAAATAAARRQAAAASVVNAPTTGVSAQGAAALLQRSAVRQVSTSGGQALVGVLRQQSQAAQEVTEANTKKTKSIVDQSGAEGKARGTGITYLSTLSAIHAASFLLSSQTFTLIGSFTTLGLAFSKLGGGFVAGGLALGAFLAGINAVTTVMGQMQALLIGVAQGATVFGAAFTAAAVGAGAASTKMAADIESSLALVQAIEGATREQLRLLSDEAQRLALTFGVSTNQIIQAASLFTRAGGDIEGAINGATEAIVKLQIASAGELQAAEAARAVAVGIEAFNKEGATAIQIADAIAATAQRSALSFTEVSQAFQQAVPGSVTLGITLADLSAIITTLGNSALRGSVAGTSFKQFLLDLVAPSKQAQEQLNKLGVNIRAADGSIRPIIDVIGDLNESLEQLTAGDKAEALARIFESRAGLAGAILSRQTVEQLRSLRSELEGLSVTNITDILLLPLNRQLEILRVSAERLGEVFGGPLLNPARTAITAIISLVQGLIPLVTLAGQAVAVVLANQGFGALSERISEVAGNSRLAIFLQGIVNIGRNVRDVIVSQIIPAIEDFIGRMAALSSESGRLTDMVGTFESINKTIQFVGAVIASVIKNFAQLVVEMVHGEGTGGRLRDTISNLATVLATQLVVGLAATGAFLAITVRILEGIGHVIRTIVIPLIQSLANAFIGLANVADTIVVTLGNPFASIIRLATFAKELLAGAGIEEASERASEAAARALPIQTQLGRGVLDTARNIAAGIKAATDSGETGVREIDTILRDARASANNTIQTFQELSGEIPSALDNLLASVKKAQTEASDQPRSQGAPTIGGIDEKELERTRARVIERFRDLQRRLQSLREDAQDKEASLVAKGLEKIEDIEEKASSDIIKLHKDRDDRLADLEENFRERRSDRSATQSLERSLEDQMRARERHFEDIERLEARTLDNTRLARSRATDDEQRAFDRSEAASERVFGHFQEDAERAFRNVQRIRDRAFDEAQSAEERSLQRSLDAQSRARDESEALKGAKTPEERKAALDRIQSSRANAAFEAQQRAQADALRKRQEDARFARQQQQEAEQVTFRRNQEAASIKFRLAQETVAIKFRQGLEDRERTVRQQEEDAALIVSRQRADDLFNLRRANAEKLQALQDGFDQRNHDRQLLRIRREAAEREAEITSLAIRQAKEVVDATILELDNLAGAQENTIRDLGRSLDDILENVPEGMRGILSPLIAGETAKLAEAAEALRTAQTELAGRVLEPLNERRLQLQTTLQPPDAVGLQRQFQAAIPTQVLTTGTIFAGTLTIQGGFAGQVAQGVLQGMVAADQQGVNVAGPQVNLDPLLTPLQQIPNAIRQIFR